MKIFIPAVIGLSLASLTLSGCASFKSRTVTQQVPAAQIPVLPRVQTYPVTGQVADAGKQITFGEPNAVWRPTVIAKVKVDGYVDENNVMWAPSEGFVVVQEGGWNIDAVRKGNTYVPPENSIKPMNLPGLAYGSATVARAPRTEARSDALPLYDLDNGKVLYTNLIRPEDEAQARAMAGKGNVAVFDPRIGWVVVPQAAAKDALEITGRMPEVPVAPIARRDAVQPQPTPGAPTKDL